MTTAARRLRSAVGRAVARPSGARRYLAPGLSLDDFFAELQRRDVSYVVLRWFEDLPHVADGEDVDLLVADEHLAVVHSLMAPGPMLARTQKFDIYSVSGLPGSDFRGVPYYSPRFASAVLARSEWLHGRYRVPCPQDHYDSLAYHAVYHKGYASGLRDGLTTDAAPQPSDHDYAGVLQALGERVGRTVLPTLESLDTYLAGQDLRPPLDTLERLETGNRWISDHLLSGRPPVDDLWRGLAVFVLRDRADAQLDVTVRELDRQGFEVLEVVRLDEVQRETTSHRLRGGNWGRGPWPVSGGPPSAYVIAYDLAPDVDPASSSGDNRRILPAKEHVRARLMAQVPVAERYNPVHSSDNPGQALDYLEALADPALLERVRRLAERLRESCEFPYPVVRSLPGEARRAQVAVVEHPVHGPAVCKVFRPGALRFFEREMRARKDLGDLPEVPGLLESGEAWLITPLYTDDASHVRRELPGSRDVQLTPTAARALARFAVALHERGLFLLDLSTRNLMSDPVAGLKVIDLEFMQEYAGAPPVDPLGSYTFWGLPAGVTGYDEPLLGQHVRRFGPTGPSTRQNSAFHPAVTGSSVRALVHPLPLLDRPWRRVVQAAWYVLLLQKTAYTRVRLVAEGSGVLKDLRAVRRLLARLVRRR